MNIRTVVSDLKLDEGWCSTAYKDTLGIWTVGYGFNIDKDHGGQLPKPIGNMWLEYEVSQRWKSLIAVMPWVENQPAGVQRALVNMVYQLGLGGLLRFKKMLKALQEGDRDLAADEALDSRWAQQTPNRAQRVSAWIRADAQ